LVKYKTSTSGAFNFCLVEGTEDSGICCLTRAGKGDHVTQFGVAYSIGKLETEINKEDFWNDSSPEFHTLKHLGAFFPVRCKLKSFLLHVNGFVPDFATRLVKFSETRHPTPQRPNKELTEAGANIIKTYTTQENWYCTRINLLLATDMIKGQWATFAKDLKSCIGWQTPKYSGKVYRGALHSPMEIFIMSFKRYFYIPSFVSTATDPTKMIFEPHPKEPDPMSGYQNVIFEIDTTEFPNFTTLIQTGQTLFDETESLLSCYNIYSWQGFRLNKWIHPDTKVEYIMPVVSLKIEDYVGKHDLDQQRIIGPICNINEKWLGGRGEIVMTRSMQPESLTQHVAALWDSYHRNYGSAGADPYPLTWLNTTFKVGDNSKIRNFIFDINENPLQVEGHSIDGVAFEKLVAQQNARRGK